MQLPHALLRSSSKNKKKIPRKKFLTFQEMELSGSNIKTFLYFLKRKLFSYISRNGTLQFSAQARKIKKNFLYFNINKFFIFSEKKAVLRQPRKNSLYFKKRSFLIFQETRTLNNFLYFRKQLSGLEK